jgi:uncharacterized membrane protein YjdF
MNAIRTLFKRDPWLVCLTVAYVAGFSFYYVAISNFEFLGYVAVLVFFLVLIVSTLSKTGFPLFVLRGLSLWGLLHMAGGGIVVGGDVLYALELVPLIGEGESFILKYDQLVHFYGFFITTFVVYHLLSKNVAGARGTKSAIVFSAFASMGLSVVNELVEFIAVVALPETGVGGYYNTLLDLSFNTLGAIAAAAIIYIGIQKENSGR